MIVYVVQFLDLSSPSLVFVFPKRKTLKVEALTGQPTAVWEPCVNLFTKACNENYGLKHGDGIGGRVGVKATMQAKWTFNDFTFQHSESVRTESVAGDMGKQSGKLSVWNPVLTVCGSVRSK